MMKPYISTRGQQAPQSFYEAILQGLADDGGLFVPQWDITCLPIAQMGKLSYVDVATEVMAPFVPEEAKELLRNACCDAYATGLFDEGIVPVRAVGELSVAELWHGQTAAFKDMALSLLPRLMTLSRKQLGDQRRLLILTATSGDTGKAALEGFRDVEGTEIMVFYPTDGVSSIQRRQMVTQQGKNVYVIGIRGNFDDAQRAVKQAMRELRAKQPADMRLSSANSINIGRLLPQVVYYVWSYLRMVEQGQLTMGDEMNVCVPSGNFGNCLAAYIAREMGLPIHRLIVASNKNHVLTDFFRTGRYDIHRAFYPTNAPSMDILLSSNLERLLWWMSGRDSAHVRQWMEQLQQEGYYEVDDVTRQRIQSLIYADYASEEDVLTAIASCWGEHHYLLDTHTACAWHCAQRYRQQTGDKTPMLVVATANAYKFPEAVGTALGGDIESVTGEPIPRSLCDIAQRKELHTRVIERDEILPTIEQCFNQ